MLERTGALDVIGAEHLYGSNPTAAAAHAARAGQVVDPDAIAHEAAAALAEMSRLSTDTEVRRRLERAIEALEPGRSPDP